jgi:hypothetical protein
MRIVMPRRIALLTFAVLVSLAQKADAPVSVRAGLCEKVERDPCGKASALFGFAPRDVRVTYRIPKHAENRRLAFGLFCDSAEYSTPLWPLDGANEPPQMLVTYPRVSGTCQAVVILTRQDGKQYRAVSETLTIEPR